MKFFMLSNFNKHDKTQLLAVLKNYVHRVQSHLKFSKVLKALPKVASYHVH